MYTVDGAFLRATNHVGLTNSAQCGRGDDTALETVPDTDAATRKGQLPNGQ